MEALRENEAHLEELLSATLIVSSASIVVGLQNVAENVEALSQTLEAFITETHNKETTHKADLVSFLIP